MRSATILTQLDVHSMTLPSCLKRCATYVDHSVTEKTSSLAHFVESLSIHFAYSSHQTRYLSISPIGNVLTVNSVRYAQVPHQKPIYCIAMCATKPSIHSV